MNSLIAFAAQYLYLLIIIIALLTILLSPKTIRNNFLKIAVLALPIAYLTGRLASWFFYNPRPFVVEHVQPLIAHAADNGFPSDHTLFTMTVASIIFVYRRKMGLFLAALGLTVGFARVLAKVHHSLDIVAASSLAILAVYLSFKILSTLLKNFKKSVIIN